MFNDIFEQAFEPDGSPVDTTDINQFILYFSDKEFPEFKRLLKEAMKRELPTSFQASNASDIMMLILRKFYGQGAVANGTATNPS